MPAKAGSEATGQSYIPIQQTINNDGCVFGHLKVSSHQETHCAVETVQQVAEVRHQAVIYNLTATAEEHHRAKVVQLMGEANRAFEEQAKGHAAATAATEAGSRR